MNRFGLRRSEPGGAPNTRGAGNIILTCATVMCFCETPKASSLPDHAAALRHAQQLALGFKWIRWSIHVIDEQGRAIGTIE